MWRQRALHLDSLVAVHGTHNLVEAFLLRGSAKAMGELHQVIKDAPPTWWCTWGADSRPTTWRIGHALGIGRSKMQSLL